MIELFVVIILIQESHGVYSHTNSVIKYFDAVHPMKYSYRISSHISRIFEVRKLA